MPNYLFDFPNATTPDGILVETATTMSSLTPLFLLFLFIFIFMGGVSRQKLRSGTADYPMWAVVGSLGTLMMALILGIKPGLISLEWTVIVAVITIFCGVWLFLDRKINEQ